MTKEEYQIWLRQQEERKLDPTAQRIDALVAKAYFQWSLSDAESKELDELIKKIQQGETS